MPGVGAAGDFRQLRAGAEPGGLWLLAGEQFGGEVAVLGESIGDGVRMDSHRVGDEAEGVLRGGLAFEQSLHELDADHLSGVPRLVVLDHGPAFGFFLLGHLPGPGCARLHEPCCLPIGVDVGRRES